MFRYKNIILTTIQILITLFWAFYEFIIFNNHICGIVYSEVFPNGFSESEKLSVYLITDVTNKLSYLILFLLIVYLAVIIINFNKEEDLKDCFKNIILLIIGFVIIIVPKYWIMECFDLNELSLLKQVIRYIVYGIIMIFGLRFFHRKKTN